MHYDITNLKIEDYITSLMPARSNLLAEMEQQAYLHGWPLLGPVEGQFLSILSKSIGARNVLEIGTATGYAAMWLLNSVVPVGGSLTAIEVHPDRYRLAQELVERAGYSKRLNIIAGLWSDVLPTLTGPYDLIFLDVLRSLSHDDQALQALEMSLPLLRPGGLLIGDNVLCSAQVIEDDARPTVRGIQKFNQAIMEHPLLESVIIPLRDGVSISRKKD